ncbi:hypothetical protein H6G41_23950 [Tolypothrix sp. FACHB-123]|uniref:hypothetical protein n=1 Tax=Tolypothrix sp. FACHB-123 TaxID=2692868 RepID=UPI000B5FB550|nr:hypothetical protein [Tolypothrix sp. FACHB-123]MBD2357629.1 hypothetical protein [Tolypothrix sp. FACHB-123]BAY66946.1 hypothetical protein NIES22_70900 [Calothrix brevissima NIES-22]
MNYLRTDIISIFDLDFVGDSISSSTMHKLEKMNEKTEIETIYKSSYRWIFYQGLFRDFQRFYFKIPISTSTGKDCSILVNQEYGIGIVSIWQTFRNVNNPIESKQKVWNFDGTRCSEIDSVFKLFSDLDIEGIERHYPFASIQINSDNISQFCSENAAMLGRLFTGGYEHEEEERLEKYIKHNNISSRHYERLFIRWTDALAVYSNYIKDNEYELSLFRAAQIFETCILLRRVFKNISAKSEKISSSLSVINPNPWAVNKLQSSFSRLERNFVIAPPISSVEAEGLLKAAYKNFGIFEMIESTRKECEFMERRFQWVKTQFIVSLAILTYFLDKIWDIVKELLIKK